MRLLVTGATGLLGANLVLAAADRGLGVWAVSRSPLNPPPGVRCLRADLAESGAAAAACGEARPDWVLHCAAETNVDRCESNPEAAADANVGLTRAVVDAASAVGARVLYVSTDAVFPGERGGYAEEDAVQPVNEYARTKLAGEAELARAAAGGVILRTNLYGWNARRKLSLAEWILERWERGEVVPGFTDVVFNPLLVNDLAEVMLGLAAREARGVYHAGSRDAASKFEFARRLAGITGHALEQVVPTRLEAAGLRAPRPLNTWLRTDRLAGILGRPLPSMDEGLRRFVELGERGHRDRLRRLLA